MPRLKWLMLSLQVLILASSSAAFAWGPRAHTAIDRAAVTALPEDGPVFLHDYVDFIGNLALLPDAWRRPSEPFAKMAEDPNHGWFREQFSFMKDIPRSRHEFLIALLDEQRKAENPESEAALRTNVRWTGTMPYAVMEAYGRLVAGMRLHRSLSAQGLATKDLEAALAFDVVRLGHYIGDGAQPLHVSIHSDGWRGENPHDYTTDRSIHGRVETGFVDTIALTQAQVLANVGELGRQTGDLFTMVLDFLDESASWMERVYILEKQGAFENPEHKEARQLIYQRTGVGATMLRDMIYRAWRESGTNPQPGLDPLNADNARYNPETGSAPAQRNTKGN